MALVEHDCAIITVVQSDPYSDKPGGNLRDTKLPERMFIRENPFDRS